MPFSSWRKQDMQMLGDSINQQNIDEFDCAEDTHCRNEQTKQDYNETNEEKIPKILPPSPCCSNLIQYLDKYLSWMLLNSTFTDEDIENFTNIFKLLQLKSHMLEQVNLKCDEVEKGMKEQKEAA